MQQTKEEKQASTYGAYWYNKGFRGQALNEKIKESLFKGRLEDNESESCTKDICG